MVLLRCASRGALAVGLGLALLSTFFLVTNAAAGQSFLPAASTIIVTNLNDSGPGSLRQAIAGAVAGDTIVFDPALAGATIVLQSGELVVDKDLRIEGPASQRLVVSGNHTSRVLRVTDGVSVTVTSLAIMHGQAAGGEITGTAGESGGGISNAGELHLLHCIVAENAAGRGRDGSGYYPGNPITATLGGDGGGIFSIGALKLSDTTVRSNTAGAGGAGSLGCYWCSGVSGEDGGQGGGIYTAGRLFVTDSAIGQNHAGDGGHYGDGASDEVGGSGGAGGGVYTTGQMTVTRSSFVANWAGEGGDGEPGCGRMNYCNQGGPGGHGGGIFNAGTLSLSRTLLDSNRAGRGYTGYTETSTDGGHGGGLYNRASARLVDAMMVSNRGGEGLRGGSGGGIYSSDRLQLERVTLQANAAGTGHHGHDGGNGGDGGHGAGIHNLAVASLTYSTVAGNSTAGGGQGGASAIPGVDGDGGNGGGINGSFTGINTILAGNQAAGAGPDCAGEVAAGGFDLIQNPSGCTIGPAVVNTIVFAAPLLGPLQVNVPSQPCGPETRALLFSSPAIDAGNCSSSAVSVDERGVPRPQGAGCDIGAYEYEPDRWQQTWLPLSFHEGP